MDRLIETSVEEIRDRFGVNGLRDMIRLAQEKLAADEALMAQFAQENAARSDQEP